MAENELKSPEEREAASRTAKVLEQALSQISSPAEADRTLDELERRAGAATEGEVADGKSETSSQIRTRRIERVADADADEPAAVISEAARQAAHGEPVDDTVIDAAVERASGQSAATEQAPAPEMARRGREILREQLIRRLGPLDAADAFLYWQINHLPHPLWADRWMGRLTWAMTGGYAWLAVLAVAAILRPRQARAAVLGTLPALWLTTAAVECPIKRYCRRKRPFISIMRAIVVGRKPGSYSFPSGHSAAAFAGAVLLSRYFPKVAPAFFAIAGLTAFSRIYLGAHYPGDVVSGSMGGVMLAKGFARLLRKRASRRADG